MTYRVEFAPLAQRQMRKLPREMQGRILERIAELVTNPRPMGVKKLVDEENLYRTRMGDCEGGSDAMDVRYVVDQAGKPRKVILDIEEYEGLLERAEDAEALAFLRQFEIQPHEYVSLEEALAGLDPDV